MDRTTRILFQPFEVRTWFVLGFCAFLANLGRGGGSDGGVNYSRGQSGNGPSGRQILDWVHAHLALVVSVGILIFLILLAVGLVMAWLSSRGKFMFLDGVVRGRGAVVEPWSRYRAHGNSLFRFRIVFGLSVFALVLLIVGFGVAVAWGDISSGSFGPASATSIVICGPLLLGLLILSAIVGVLLEDFVIPAMYLNDVPVTVAWQVVHAEVLRGRAGTIVLYLLMKLVLGIGVGILALMATCATCCLAAIPYLGSVILLPLLVFIRCYSVCFLEQLGPDWRFFDRAPPEGAEGAGEMMP